MEIKVFEFNPVAEKTYILYDETHECVIIDAGSFYPDEEQHLFGFITDNDLVIRHLLNTHLHFDHVLGNAFVEEQFHVQPEANKQDEFLLDQMPTQLQMFGFPSIQPTPSIGKYLKENDVVKFGNQKLLVLDVPGHSPGSIAFYSSAGECVFVGDTLFRTSIGRTDLPGGNQEQLLDSIRTKLLILPPETVVYPGHGPATTIREEKMTNPFLR